jgi:hypothetical protein
MNRINYFTLFFFFLQVLSNPLYCQVQQQDSAFYTQSFDSVEAFYIKAAAANLSLYNGCEYSRPPVSTKGFPFFESENLIEGSVFYDGNLYRHVNLQYDIVKDELVIANFSKNAVVKLISEKVAYFTLQQHTFIYVNPDKNTIGIMAGGFYEKLFGDNNIAVLARRFKMFKQSLPGEENYSIYNEGNLYFLKKDGRYHAVTDKHSLLDLLSDKKDELKIYIKTNTIKFNKDLEHSILKVSGYYCLIKN